MSDEMLEPEKWAENYADMLYRYPLVLFKDPDVADEFVQVTLFAAFKSQHTFVGKLTEKIWLFGVLNIRPWIISEAWKKYHSRYHPF